MGRDRKQKPKELPMDTEMMTLVESQQQNIADQVRDVISQESVRFVKAQVTAITERAGHRFMKIRRPENTVADAKEYPLVSTAFPPAVNDWIVGLETPGGIVAMGREGWTTDKSVPGLASGADIDTNSIGTRQIMPAGVDNEQIAQLSVSNTRLSAGSVGTTKILDGNVTDAKLYSNYSLSGHGHGTHRHNHGYYWVAGYGMQWYTDGWTGYSSV